MSGRGVHFSGLMNAPHPLEKSHYEHEFSEWLFGAFYADQEDHSTLG